MAERETGTVKWFNDAYGFGLISRKAGEDLFLHCRVIQRQDVRACSKDRR